MLARKRRRDDNLVQDSLKVKRGGGIREVAMGGIFAMWPMQI